MGAGTKGLLRYGSMRMSHVDAFGRGSRLCLLAEQSRLDSRGNETGVSTHPSGIAQGGLRRSVAWMIQRRRLHARRSGLVGLGAEVCGRSLVVWCAGLQLGALPK